MVREKTRFKNQRQIVAIVATLVIVIAGVLIFLYRDELFSRSNQDEETKMTSLDPYTYENGASQEFALMGKSLAISSSTGLQLLDGNGYSVVRQVFSMKNPAVVTGDKHCAFYDVGGTALRVYSNGSVSSFDTTGNIISVSMNSAGYFVVTAEEAGYKGSVTVYDDKGEAVYKWYSGTGYVIDAGISPNSASLAVLCLESGGSVVHLFKLSGEDETATVQIPGEVAFKVIFTDNNSLCTLSEDFIRFFGESGKEESFFDFEESYLIDFSITENLCVVALSEFISGSTVTYTGFSANGRVLGTAELDYPPLSLSQYKQRLMVLGNGTATIFSRDLSINAQGEVSVGYGQAVYLPDGYVLLLSSYHGEKVSVK